MVEPRRRAGQENLEPGADTPRPDHPPTELGRLRSEAAFHQRLRDLTLAFSQGVSSTQGLGNSLPPLASEANDLLTAHRTSVWLHQRRFRQLTLAGSSDPAHAAAADPVPTDDVTTPAARGLRLEGPVLVEDSRPPVLLAPLR